MYRPLSTAYKSEVKAYVAYMFCNQLVIIDSGTNNCAHQDKAILTTRVFVSTRIMYTLQFSNAGSCHFCQLNYTHIYN